MNPTAPLPPDALDAIRRGNKIEAIRIVRQRESIGLAEAKTRVESYVANDPLLREQMGGTVGAGARGCLLLVVILLAIAAIAYLYLT